MDDKIIIIRQKMLRKFHDSTDDYFLTAQEILKLPKIHRYN